MTLPHYKPFTAAYVAAPLLLIIKIPPLIDSDAVVAAVITIPLHELGASY
jgi:hypothetical protein